MLMRVERSLKENPREYTQSKLRILRGCGLGLGCCAGRGESQDAQSRTPEFPMELPTSTPTVVSEPVLD